MLIDSHLHLDMEAFDADRDTVVARSGQSGVVRMITIGTDPSGWRKTLDLADRYEAVFAAVGLHPHDAGAVEGSWLPQLEAALRHPKVLALGEIGLDYYRDYSPREDQMRVFRRQLDLAVSLGRPVIIHCREAMAEVLVMLREAGAERVGGIMHCFSGTWEDACQTLELGFSISVAGPLTFPKSHRLAGLVAQLPMERLLVETYAPFLAPAPHRGERNEPAYVRFVAEKMAELKGMSLEEVATQTTANLVRLLGIPP